MMQTDKIHASEAARRHGQDFPEPVEIAAAAVKGEHPVGEA